MTPRRRRPSEAIAEGAPVPRGAVDDDEAAALAAAIELAASRPAADLPSPDFVDDLRRRLRELDGGDQRRLGRRAFLTAAGIGAGAVAAGVAGVAVDRVALSGADDKRVRGGEALAPASGDWVAVAPTDAVAGKTVRFATTSAVGFVTEHHGELVAVSGACSHQGCLLRLNEASGRLDCPCHRTAFSPQGEVLFYQLDAPPPKLTQIQVRRRNDAVEVLVPKGDEPQRS
jgi:Rieske Fe-S protein